MELENFLTHNDQPEQKARLTRLGPANETPILINNFFTMGSDSTCHYQSPLLSPKHFLIEYKNNRYNIKDLNSKTGSYINDTQIIQGVLQNGDIIKAENQYFKFEITSKLKKDSFLTSKNVDWAHQLKRVPSISKSNHIVTIVGPSGTGKELMARKIHELSARSKGPFVSINCSALSEQLVESELFGHEKGSFTDANEFRKGAFQTARAGTLFLDEIGDLPLSLQPKLLRALDNQEIKPVGSDHTISTDTRILVATHLNLQNQVNLGQFRLDLFYRLNILNIQMPMLSERMEDFDDIFYKLCKTHHIGFTFQSIEKLKKHSWPGNIRELRNVILRASAIYRGQKVRVEELADILDPIQKSKLSSTIHQITEHQNQIENTNKSMVNIFEKQLIIEKLIEFKGNQRRVADEIRIPKSTLYDKIQKYNINVKKLK